MKVEFTYYDKFLKIALDNYEKVQELVEKRDEARAEMSHSGKSYDEGLDFQGQMNDTIEEYTLIVVIFCAAALEAYINDYAINRLSKAYLERHLDKLDLASKWIVIPRIINGKQLDKGSKWFNDLSWLISLRNRLVHYKTKVCKIEEIASGDFLFEEDAGRALETVKQSVLALKEVDKKIETRWLEYRCQNHGI
jgi:hypothetical protein